VELDPLAQLYNWMLAWSFIALRDYDSAAAQSRVLLDIDPGFWMGHLQKGMLLAAGGAHAEAVQSIEDALRLSGGAAAYAIGYLACLTS